MSQGGFCCTSPVSSYCHCLLMSSSTFFLVCNSCGYVPLSGTYLAVVTEAKRQSNVGMDSCLCSNCDPAAADAFLRCQVTLTSLNFPEVVVDRNPIPDGRYLVVGADSDANVEGSDISILEPVTVSHPRCQDLRFIRLYLNIEHALIKVFNMEYPNGSYYQVHDLFGTNQIWSVVVNYQAFLNGSDLDYVFGSEPLPNYYHVISNELQLWRASRDIIAILHPSSAELLLQEQQKQKTIESFKKKDNAKQLAAAKDNGQVSFVHS